MTQCVSYGDYHVTVRRDVIGLERGRVSMLKICFELVADFKEFNRNEMINLVLYVFKKLFGYLEDGT